MADTSNNNSTGNPQVDSLMDYLSGGGNNTATATPPAQQGQGINIQQLLGGLLQAGGNGLNAASNFVNPQDSQPNAYQKGVNKALQDAGTAHATQALQQGVDPNSIVNHNIMQPSQQSDPTQVLAGLAAMAMKQQGQTQQQPALVQQQQSQPSIDDQIANINKQAQLNVASKNLQQSQSPQGLLDKFGQNVRDLSGLTAARNASNEIVQKTAAGEPIQPKDVADLNANTYKAALEASHNAATAEATKLPALVDLYGKLQATRGFGATITGTASKDQQSVLNALKTAGTNFGNHVDNLQTLINNRPKFTSKGIDNQAQGTVSKIQEGQTATNQKTGQKIVFKGGKWIPQQ